MKYTPLLLILLFFSDCTTYVQVFKTKSSTGLKSDDGYVFENDSVKIEYNFWAEHGVLYFTVFNKLNTPLYIDWKKSSFIRDDQKLDYYTDVERTNSSTEYSSLIYSYAYWGINEGVANTASVKTKPERITFIAPHSEIKKNQFYLLNATGVALRNDVKVAQVKNTKDTSKTATVFYKIYKEPKESMLVFRNFLTFSTTEDFKTEFYVDNGFYLSKLTEMKTGQFQGKVSRTRDAQNNYVGDYEYPYENGCAFFITNIPFPIIGSGEAKKILNDNLKK